MTNTDDDFAQVAGRRDEIRAGYFTERMQDAAIVRAQPRSGDVVADPGAGTGFVAIARRAM
jgi:ubiquinone/menaquinone biosynthesis C-methylase UbiE